jgi:hypothetical protein
VRLDYNEDPTFSLAIKNYWKIFHSRVDEPLPWPRSTEHGKDILCHAHLSSWQRFQTRQNTRKHTAKKQIQQNPRKTQCNEQTHGKEWRHVSFLAAIDRAVMAARLCRVSSNGHTAKKLGPSRRHFFVGAISSRLKFCGWEEFPAFPLPCA